MVLDDSTLSGKVTGLQFQHHERFFRNLIFTADTIANRRDKAKAGIVPNVTQQYDRTLSGTGMDLKFTMRREREPVRTVNAKLVKTAR